MISSSHHTYGNDGESGFALVELLVAMAISIVVLFGILLTLDGFSSNASRQTRVTDANDQVRKVMDPSSPIFARRRRSTWRKATT